MKRPLILFALCAMCTGVILCLHLQNFAPLVRFEDYSHDLRVRLGRQTPIDPRLVYVGIDRDNYGDFVGEEDFQQAPMLRKLVERFPWSRDVWAELIERLMQAGAKVVAFDLLFAAPAPGDDQLRNALTKYRDRVVIGINFTEAETDRGSSLTLPLPSDTLSSEPGMGFSVEDDRLGFVNIWPDVDGVARRARYRLSPDQSEGLLSPGVVAESLAARCLRKFGRVDVIPSGSTPVLFRFTRPPSQGYKPISVYTLFLPRFWTNNFGNGEFFKDKIILVGPAANLFHDEHTTPFAEPRTQMLGPELHLNLMGAALHGEILHEWTPAQQQSLIIVAGVLAFGLHALFRGALLRLLALVLFTTGYGWAAQLLYDRANLVVLAATPLLVFNSSSLLCFSHDWILERMEKRRVRRTLERYVSKDVVRELLDNPSTFFNSLIGVRRPVTVLFSDVRNFTTMTEEGDSAALVAQLNEYFREMVNPVFQQQGSIDKFMGDAIMAIWGSIATRGTAQDARNAVHTALQMKSRLARLNESWRSRGLPELSIGIGINHGEVIVGNLGSEEKMELTVIGDPVNLASRLEGLTKEYHLDLLVGEAVAPLVREQFILRTVDLVQVKGKTKPVQVFTVLSERPAGAPDPEWLQQYEEGVRLYRERQFAQALELLREGARQHPDDYLIELFLERAQFLAANPPGPDWNGVSVMTKK